VLRCCTTFLSNATLCPSPSYSATSLWCVATLFKDGEIWQYRVMTTITLEKAQQDLPLLVNRALAGEEIVIAAGDRLVRLAPSPAETSFNEATARRRGYGSMKGQLVVGPEFFEPLSDEECGYGDDKATA
jgi:antitoxin (DNA-binding transcriptional repressor) of toxin-antitoxin stability system